MSLKGSLVESDWAEKGGGPWDDRPLLATPWPTIAVLAAYLYFVLHAGPRLMENRPPYRLRGLIAAYNLILVIGSTWLVFKLHYLSRDVFFTAHCRPSALKPELSKEINQLSFYYFFSKVIELLDTVFFVLRRKMNQVSFLHMYHHTNMVMLTWVFLKIVPGSQLIIIAYSNTFVHILMYAYYFLSSLGPSVQKYLWWKKYLTTIQMIQFLIIMGFLCSLLLFPGCQVSKEMITLAICNTGSFLVLFLFFYSKEYRKRKTKPQAD